MENTQTKKTNPPADKLNSTYWWEINLDHRHPRNYNYKVETLSGYSKFQGHDEAKDKVEMLQRKILMLATNGYFERSKYILIYKRAGTFINKSSDKLLLTLLPKDYILPTENVGKMPKTVIFLSKLYDCIKTGKEIKYLLPKPRSTFNKDEFFEIERYNFPSRIHLYAWAEQKIKDGHSFLQVQNFVVKYSEQKTFPV